MSEFKSEFEFTPTLGSKADVRRLVIVPHIHSFWHVCPPRGKHNVYWTDEGVNNILQWCNFGAFNSTDDPCLAVGSPYLHYWEFRREGFGDMWAGWFNDYCLSQERIRFTIYQDIGDPEWRQDNFGSYAGKKASAAFVTRATQAWSNAASAWAGFFKAAMPELHFDATTLPSDLDGDLCETFAQGVTCVTDQFLTPIGEVVVVTGPLHKTQVRAFKLKHAVVPRHDG